MKRAARLIPVFLTTAFAAACALEATREAPTVAMASPDVQAVAGSVLPAWHPPVAGWASALPDGHPPVMRMPALPQGHPPIPGWHPALPEGHPPVARVPALPEGHPPIPGWHERLPEGTSACPALGIQSERGATVPVAPRPTRIEVIRT